MSDQAVENIQKMVEALELAQRVIKDLHQAVSDLQKIAKQHEERIAQVERDAYRANNTASCLANGIQPD